MKRKGLVNGVVVFISLLIVFFAGAFSSDRTLESIAEYATQVVNYNTKAKQYCSLSIKSSQGSGSIPDSYAEFNNLYGLFGEKRVTFASAINLFNNEKKDKDHSIFIKKDEECISDNLSLYYVGPTGTKPYARGQKRFKHYVYPIETMFEDERNYDLVKDGYVAYISQQHADKLLKMNGELEGEDGTFSYEQYEKLIKSFIDIYFDDVPYTFLVQNIYYQSNYYFEGVSEVLDDFIMISYYAPINIKSEQSNIYFFRESTYQNKFFMEYINKIYSSKKFELKINHMNIYGDINDDYLLSFYYGDLNAKTAWLSIFILLISIAGLLFSLFFSYQNKLFFTKRNIIYPFFASIILYFIFMLVFKISKSVLLFTHFSCMSFFILLFTWTIAMAFFKYFTRRTKSSIGDSYHEIDL